MMSSLYTPEAAAARIIEGMIQIGKIAEQCDQEDWAIYSLVCSGWSKVELAEALGVDKIEILGAVRRVEQIMR